VTFTAAASDPDGDALFYNWNFGDGATASGASETHGYAASGTYTGTVTVSDATGATVSSSVLISVNANSFGDTIWVEDAIPAGGNPASDNGDSGIAKPASKQQKSSISNLCIAFNFNRTHEALFAGQCAAK
jgi:PKD repeat protein